MSGLDDAGARPAEEDRSKHGADYPAPQTIVASPRDPSVAGLGGLLALKLRAKRHQDLADIVALIKNGDDSAYITLEADIPVELRPAWPISGAMRSKSSSSTTMPDHLAVFSIT